MGFTGHFHCVKGSFFTERKVKSPVSVNEFLGGLKGEEKGK